MNMRVSVDSPAGDGGPPASSGATMASCTSPISNCPAAMATPEPARPAMNFFWYGIATA